MPCGDTAARVPASGQQGAQRPGGGWRRSPIMLPVSPAAGNAFVYLAATQKRALCHGGEEHSILAVTVGVAASTLFRWRSGQRRGALSSPPQWGRSRPAVLRKLGILLAAEAWPRPDGSMLTGVKGYNILAESHVATFYQQQSCDIKSSAIYYL